MGERIADGSDDLDAWICELQGRLARGELAHLGLVDIGGLKLAGEWAVRVMLANLDHLGSLPAEWAKDPLIPMRRAGLLADFRRLRAQVR